MADKKQRCPWVPLDKPFYVKYHDEEWGRAVHDDRKHFEMLILEGAQAGLSWETVLNKRENYRKAFAQFDPKKVARFTAKDVARLMKNEGIIRNKLKIQSTITNAKAFLEVQKEFGTFDKYIWQFVGNKPLRKNKLRQKKDYPARSEESDTLSQDLKKRGFKFVGTTIIYAHMQAIGMVDDHSVNCFRYKGG